MTRTATKPAPEPLGYEVWHKPHAKGSRRRKVAAVLTHAAAVALIQGDGSWYLIPIYDPNDARPARVKPAASDAA